MLNLNPEIWKNVRPFKTKKKYQVSNLGRIRVWLSSEETYKIINIKEHMNEYTFISIRDINKQSHRIGLHRLVAAAFVPITEEIIKRFEKKIHQDGIPYIVNHKNGVKNDNRANNLEWCDNKYNLEHAINNAYNKSINYIEVLDTWNNQSSIYTLQKAADALGLSKDNVLAITSLHKDKLYKNRFTLRHYRDNEDNLTRSFGVYMKVVIVKDHLTGQISIYNSIPHASKETGIKQSTVSNFLNNHTKNKIPTINGYSFISLADFKTNKNFIWPVLSKEEAYTQRVKYLKSYETNSSVYHKSIQVKDIVSDKIQVYPNIKAAAKDSNINYGTLRDHVYGINLDGNPLRIYNGKIYRLEDDFRDWSSAIPVEPKLFYKEIYVKNYKTNEITLYTSINNAKLNIHLSKDTILSILNKGVIYKDLAISTQANCDWPIKQI